MDKEKTVSLTIRLTPEDKSKLKELASSLGLSVSDYIRMATLYRSQLESAFNIRLNN